MKYVMIFAMIALTSCTARPKSSPTGDEFTMECFNRAGDLVTKLRSSNVYLEASPPSDDPNQAFKCVITGDK